MKYTAEEVRAIAKRLHDDITVADGDALMASDMLTAYADLLECIKADEGVANKLVVPVAWMCKTVNGYKVFNAEGPSFPCNAGVVSELFTHPPAQAAQVDDSAVASFVERAASVICGKSFPTGSALAKAREISDLALSMLTTPEPVAQPADSVRVTDGAPIVQQLRGRAAFLRDRGRIKSPEIMERAADALEAATPIDLAAVREVIESHINEAKKLRHDPASQDYLYEQADKLEAAIKGVE